jgi:tight adherence protein B
MWDFTPRDLGYALTLSAVMLGVLLGVMGIFYLFINPARQRRQVTRRLSEGSLDNLLRVQILKEKTEEKKTLWTALLAFILGAQRIEKLQRDLFQADIFWTVGKFLALVLSFSLAGFLAGFFVLRSFLLGAVIAVFLVMIPLGFMKWRKQKKTLAFERQMPDAMELLARSLRAGHTLPSAIELLGDEMDDPMATEMRICFEEQRYGLAMGDAMSHMLERVDSQDLRYFISALLIQQDTGGNLAELMEKIAQVIRGRLNFKVKVRALTAMGRMSAYIMIITPVVAFFLLMMVASHYEKALITTPIGQKMLITGIIFLILGSLTLRKIIRNVEA